MAGSLNKVMLIGNCCSDPEIRRLPSGGSVANIRLATNESWRDKQTGEKREKAEYHAVTVFNDNLVKVIEQYVKKGSKLYIEGQIQTRKYQDKSGADRFATEIVLQGFNGTLTLLDGPSRDDSKPQDRRPAQGRRAPVDDDMDSVPF